MAGQPEIFVRELDPEEAQKLVRIARSAKDRVRLRRAGMVLASLQGRSAGDIAAMFAAKDQTVREVIKAFNESPERRFAIGSKIRQPDYLPYAA